MGSARTKPLINHSLDPIPSESATNAFHVQRSMDYRESLIHKEAGFTIQLPQNVVDIIVQYIPPLFTVYKISKRKSSARTVTPSHLHCSNGNRAPSPTPSASSVTSFTSFTSTASSISSQFGSENRIERLSEWETMLFCPDSVYRIGKKYFVKAANREIYGMGRRGNKSLGTNLEFMSSGICAGNIAIKYRSSASNVDTDTPSSSLSTASSIRWAIIRGENVEWARWRCIATKLPLSMRWWS